VASICWVILAASVVGLGWLEPSLWLGFCYLGLEVVVSWIGLGGGSW